MPTITLRPAAAGDEENINNATSGAGNHWSDVDDITSDGDTTIVYEETNDDSYYRDLYDPPLLGSCAGTINSVTVIGLCRRYGTPSSARVSLKLACKTHATVYEGDAEILSNSYALYQKKWKLNPNTSSAWTWDEINELQIGLAMRDADGDGVNNVASMCTKLYVEINYDNPAAPHNTVRIAFADDIFDDPPNWDDVSDDLISLHISVMRQHELDRFEAGEAIVVLRNSAGNYSPNNSGGDYYPNVKRRKRINIRVAYDSVTYDEYTGFIIAWTPDWLDDGGLVPVMVLDCADLIYISSQHQINDDSGYDAELSGTRIGNVLDEIGWPADDRDIDAGEETMQATGALANENAQEHIFNVAKSEPGQYYIAGDGDVQWEDRNHRNTSPHDAALCIFGDSGDDWELPYAPRPKMALDDLLFYNEVRATRTGGSEQVVQDDTSIAAEGLSSLPVSGLLLNSDIASKAYAARAIAKYSVTSIRGREIIIYPDMQPALLYPKAFGYGISERINLRISGEYIDEDYFIEGFTKEYSHQTGVWVVTWRLTPVAYLDNISAIESTLRPNGTANTGNNTIVGGATAHEVCADESDDTYNERSNGDPWLVRLHLEDSGYSGGIINKITAYWRVNRGGGSTDLNLFIYINGQTYYGYNPFVMAGGWEEQNYEFTLNPDDSQAWEWTDIDDLIIGVATGEPWAGNMVSEMWIVVNWTPDW